MNKNIIFVFSGTGIVKGPKTSPRIEIRIISMGRKPVLLSEDRNHRSFSLHIIGETNKVGIHYPAQFATKQMPITTLTTTGSMKATPRHIKNTEKEGTTLHIQGT